MGDNLDAAEHAGCMIFDQGPPWRIAGLSWGFPTTPTPRMTLVVVAGLRFRGVRLALEDDLGNRAFEVTGKLTPRTTAQLRGWIAESRDVVESAWIRVMIARGWINVEALGKSVVVTAYPKTESEIVRTLDFRDAPVWLDQDDVAVEGVTLVLGVRGPEKARVRHPLNRIIWQGRHDGADAGCIPF